MGNTMDEQERFFVFDHSFTFQDCLNDSEFELLKVFRIVREVVLLTTRMFKIKNPSRCTKQRNRLEAVYNKMTPKGTPCGTFDP